MSQVQEKKYCPARNLRPNKTRIYACDVKEFQDKTRLQYLERVTLEGTPQEVFDKIKWLCRKEISSYDNSFPKNANSFGMRFKDLIPQLRKIGIIGVRGIRVGSSRAVVIHRPTKRDPNVSVETWIKTRSYDVTAIWKEVHEQLECEIASFPDDEKNKIDDDRRGEIELEMDNI